MDNALDEQDQQPEAPLPYMPNWHVPPAEHLVELLCALDLSPGEFALRCGGMDTEDMTGLLLGCTPIDQKIAGQLAAGSGIPAGFFLRLQENYDDTVGNGASPATSGGEGSALPEDT